MAEMKVKQFGKLVECIKETGRWIEENAEDIAPNVENMTSMTIRDTVGVACWEQFLKHIDEKAGERNENKL